MVFLRMECVLLILFCLLTNLRVISISHFVLELILIQGLVLVNAKTISTLLLLKIRAAAVFLAQNRFDVPLCVLLRLDGDFLLLEVAAFLSLVTPGVHTVSDPFVLNKSRLLRCTDLRVQTRR